MKPHSVDVETLISFYNVIKTADRSQLSPNIIKYSLYIKLNMSTLSEFNPHNAVQEWLKAKKGIIRYIIMPLIK